MKNFLFVLIAVLFTACASHRMVSDFDYSYARSGGLSPVYENLYIKGNQAHYAFESQNKKFKKQFKLSPEELSHIQTAVADSKFRMIREDYKKQYDHISTIIKVSHGDNSGVKTDAAQIMEGDRERWERVDAVFKNIIAAHVEKTTK